MSQKQKLQYFSDVFNWIDLTGLLMTLLITVMTLMDEPCIAVETLRLFAAIASCLLITKFYDWLRLFEGTAFYILLVEYTLRDIRAFLILLVVALFAFGLPMSMLNLNREDGNALIEPAFNFWLLDALYNQYLLTLGEFVNIEKMDGQSNDMVVLGFFNAATFFTQITMLNMLIAVMGDSFAQATENRAKFAIKTKLDILST